MKKSDVLKIIAVGMCAFMLLTSCGKKKEDTEKKESSSTTTAQSKEEKKKTEDDKKTDEEKKKLSDSENSETKNSASDKKENNSNEKNSSTNEQTKSGATKATGLFLGMDDSNSLVIVMKDDKGSAKDFHFLIDRSINFEKSNVEIGDSVDFEYITDATDKKTITKIVKK